MTKKYDDKSGNEINDEILLQNIANGASVISYHKNIQGEESRGFVHK